MFHALITNSGDSRYHATTRDSSFVLDTKGNGANPIDALLASLAACVGHHIIYWMRDRAIVNPGFTISATGELADDHLRFSVIALIADLRAVDRAETEYGEILAYVQRCPIFGTLSSACRIEFSLADSNLPSKPRQE